MEKVVSVIIPVYNVEKYLDKCVESVVCQTYHNLEIILIDDGSPDNCPKLCDQWAKKDERISVIHKTNGGLSDARNAGLDRATGEYISFVDSDDSITPTYIENLCDALESNNADIAVANYTKVDESGVMQPKLSEETVSRRIYTGREVLYSRFQMNAPGTVFVLACCKLYRREIFFDYRFAVGRLNEDEFSFFPIYMKAEKIVCIEDSGYFYLQRSNSIMGQRITDKRILDNIAYWQDRMELSKEDIILNKKTAVGFCTWIFLKALPNLERNNNIRRLLVGQYRHYIIRYIFDKEIDLPVLHKLVYLLAVIEPYSASKIKNQITG